MTNTDQHALDAFRKKAVGLDRNNQFFYLVRTSVRVNGKMKIPIHIVKRLIKNNLIKQEETENLIQYQI